MADQNANWIPSLAGRVDPVVEQAIMRLYQQHEDLRKHINTNFVPKASKDQQTPKPSVSNPDPVAPPKNLNGHPGLLSEPQKGMATVVTVPPTPQDILSRPGSIITYKGSVYVYDATQSPPVFRLLSALSTPIP